jgi:hypothetical protein
LISHRISMLKKRQGAPSRLFRVASCKFISALVFPLPT